MTEKQTCDMGNTKKKIQKKRRNLQQAHNPQ